MEFRYLPMTEEDKTDMLKTIGVESTDELFSDIPPEVKLDREMKLKPPENEYSLTEEMRRLSSKNSDIRQYVSFLGAGVYDHHIPSVVDHVISRSEFYTAYTPYQPEISQGELQAIFEFQTMIAELTAMDLANSSMYDGGTALAEAITLAASQTKKKKILLSESIHPDSKEVIGTYAKAHNLELVMIGENNGTVSIDELDEHLSDDVAAVAVQYPNFYGQVEPLGEVKSKIEEKAKKAMFVVSANPLALGYLTPPGAFGADIVVGDTQVFGIPAQFGGPHCGYFAVTKKLMRKVPGRLVGETVDENGERGFVLTLQAREQHIRREKATSNICSNQALNALASSVAMTSLGKEGLYQMAKMNIQKAMYMKNRLESEGLTVMFDGPFFNELVVQLPQSVKVVNERLHEEGIIGGFDMRRVNEKYEDCMLVAVTEVRSRQEIENFAKIVGGIS
ncbi:aminomethyl-transferring glycine dehydrogenase subunit GcvPA [Salimicrobium halophilum]|uniref:Probable glycine dehydrogenase (decarboxylating) subunit 1 n=1 Tax=Salimicrobium halophilum TaxID=86666 RepID=A0A1G8PU79_9BACI|nr:aminomethyl-transferring glycine dehydrogenase subunit GcvPA [Salimicrobium halophilum]SDI95826.1 glycine dehydrogenase (decarboxylating) alpha subunit [Salimicrobium halophilum]